MLYPVELRAQIERFMGDSSSPVLLLETFETGRGGGIRTHDPLLPKQMRYQAALRPEEARILQIDPTQVNHATRFCRGVLDNFQINHITRCKRLL